MIDLLESYIRHNWDSFNISSPPPGELLFLFSRGFRKVIFFVFRDNAPEPFAVLKISNDPLALDRLANEYEVLSYLSSEGAPGEIVPSPLAFFQVRGHTCVFESALKGTPMVYSIHGLRTRKGLTRMKNILGMLVEALIALSKIKPGAQDGADEQDPSIAPPVPRVIEHGDLCPANLFVSGNGHAGIIWDHIKTYADSVGMEGSSVHGCIFNFAAKHLGEEEARFFCSKVKAIYPE